ncbi:hypothetical protein F4803DRAFT_568404 [Xylaria telfairii]|nr:hypothetical protein F4803DRAFT_568404 [Xylaria telfairii]
MVDANPDKMVDANQGAVVNTNPDKMVDANQGAVVNTNRDANSDTKPNANTSVLHQAMLYAAGGGNLLGQHVRLGKRMPWDVEVSCNARVWYFRSHVLRRSPWFERALEQDFKGLNIKTINIERFDAESVAWVLEHLLTNKYNWEKLQGEKSFTQLCIHVFDLGEYFMLPYLSGSAEAGFRRMLFSLLPRFQTNDLYREVPTDELLNIIRQVYAQDNARARKIFGSAIAMILDSIRYGIEGNWLVDLVEEIPAAAVDLVKFTVRSRNSVRPYAVSCDRCKTPRSENLGFSKVYLPMSRVRCLCWHCDGQAEDMGHYGIHMNRDNL